MWSRRDILRGAGLAPLAGGVRRAAAEESKPVTADPIIQRTIPSTGEHLPAIGLGSWQTFDVEEPAKVQPVVEKFLALGGRLIDSSPMYGRSEAAIGATHAALHAAGPEAPRPWLATKVWTNGKQQGIEQMKRSLDRLGVEKLDLMQVHNLVDWKTHLPTLREWKAAGTIRYIGVTHYQHSAYEELEKIIRTEKIDFVQLPYNTADRSADKRLLPAAAEHGVAVIVMEPFATGTLLRVTRVKRLPAVAKDLGCTSWAQLLLKWIIGHPAVTCPIPATSKVSHLEDDLGALRGPLPTPAQRSQIASAAA